MIGFPLARAGESRRRAPARARLWALVSLALGVGVCSFAAPAFGGLPEGRVYEQVSPEFKGGYPVLGYKGLSELAASGERAAFTSVGAFARTGANGAVNWYVARRTGDGWATEAVDPHAPVGECIVNPNAFSADLSRVQLFGLVGGNGEECEFSSSNTILVREPDGSLSAVSPVMTTSSGIGNGGTVRGASADLSRVLLVRTDSLEDHVLPEEIADETVLGEQVYEVEGGHARLAAVNNSGVQLTTYCSVSLGGAQTEFGAVSQPAASEVFFGVAVGSRNSTGQCGGAGFSAPLHPEELFLRAGSQTVEVSRPLGEACSEVPCPKASVRGRAEFQGASEDGSLVYFTMADTANERLVPGNLDQSSDLYVAKIGCAGGLLGEACGSAPREVVSLELASPDVVAGQAAEVQPDVLAVSPDGSHVYFVARGVLSEAANGQGEVAVDGAENLYVYDRSSVPGRVSFIADLCSGGELSGSARDGRCRGVGSDASLWISAAHEAQTTPDGRFLVFGTLARLISSGVEADTDSSEDVYRYDSATGILRRVSVAEAGQDGNGNGPFDARIAVASSTSVAAEDDPQAQQELSSRAISADGSRVVFVTSEPLSARDATGQRDVYVWDEGSVGMVSCGCSIEADEEPVITPSGRDIMFLTAAGLVPGDTDGLADLYDARIGGGFPEPQAPSEPCLADACYGPLSAPGPVLVPGSASQPAGGNLPAPAATTVPVTATANMPKKATKTKKKKKKKRTVRKRRGRTMRGKARRARTSSRARIDGGHGG